MTATRNWMLFAIIAVALAGLAGPADAAVDDATLHIDPVSIEAPDRSSEPLAGWDDIGLGDPARNLLRTPDLIALRLAPGRDEHDRAAFAPLPVPYDDMDLLNAKRLLLHAPEHNTLRNFLILMFLTGDN